MQKDAQPPIFIFYNRKKEETNMLFVQCSPMNYIKDCDCHMKTFETNERV